MPRQTQPFQIIERGKKSGRSVFYVRFRDEAGDLLPWQIAGGATSRTAARAWAQKRVKSGVVATRQNFTFGKYAEAWWIWDRCQYIRGKLARGQRISPRYARYQRRNLERYILPTFSSTPVLKITTGMVERWLLDLHDKRNLSGLTANHVLATLKVMFGEAFRLGVIPSDPSARVAPLKESSVKRNVLTLDEIKQLFDEAALAGIWSGNEAAFTGGLLGIACALRIGEIQALKIGNVSDGYIAVEYAWARSDGLVEPKYGSRRVVPLPARVELHVRNLIEASRYGEPDDFLFAGKSRETPLDHKYFTKRLTGALAHIGIDEPQRVERGLTFHSLRHAAASMMRGRVPDHVVQALTGHRSERMLGHYSHVTRDALASVAVIQREVIG